MKRICMFISVLILQFPVLVLAQEILTLEDSVKLVTEKSYSIRSADAEVSARQGDLSQSTAWPNPNVELNVNEKLGIQDNSGGNDLSEISISQPIPLGRLSRQQKESNAKLQMAKQNLAYQRLLQEAETARRFHLLQLKTSKLDLAQEQLKFAKDYQKNSSNSNKNKKDNDTLVRYLTPLEQKRLNIILATSEQEVDSVEGEYGEALSGLKTLLQLSVDSSYKTDELRPVQFTETLEDLVNMQKEYHPAIKALQYQQEAANAGISLAWGELFPDPSLTVFRETDSFNEGRQDFYGVTINFQIPIWDFKRGSISKAKHEAEKVKYDLKTIEQELQAKLHQSYLHLERLVKQAEHYKTNVLVPANEVLKLTQAGFDVGEVDVLALVDANNTYFDARKNYLELLYAASLESLEVRLAAGTSLLDNKDFNSNNSVGGK